MDTHAQFWEQTYADGLQLNRYPYDFVVSFVFRNYPKEKKKDEVNILELGCGAGNNLWFAAKEGFNVTGIDFSKSAISYAEKRFADEGLKGEFITGDFSCVKNLKKKYDLVIDRAALCSTTLENVKIIIADVKNIMSLNGKMFFNPYSDRHSSSVSGVYAENGMVINITNNISDITELFFYGKRDIVDLFKNGFIIESLQHLDMMEISTPEYFNHAEWRVIAKKIRED